MYYPAVKECILNSEDRFDRPDLLTPETTDQVIYYDNQCAGGKSMFAQGCLLRHLRSF